VNSENLKKIMNPFEWFKTLYGAFGAKNPTASLIVVMIVTAMIGGAFWTFSAYLYHRDLPKAPTAITQPMPPKSGNATTTGDQSPAVTGDGNRTTYGQPSDSKEPKSKPPN
jgi:hypothetical protein